MKNFIIIFFSSVIFTIITAFVFQESKSPSSFGNESGLRQDGPLRTQKNEAFRRGEKLTYRMHYGFINAGEVTMSVIDENRQIGGRNTLHVVGIGNTNSSFDWFFKVRDRYESYIDEEAIIPWLFIRRVSEGGYKIEQNQIFNHYKNTMDMNGKKFDVPDNVQDMTSAFYYARTIDFSNAKEGDIFEFPCFVDDTAWSLKIKFMGKETINSDIGKIRCIRFHPVVQKGRVFKKEEDMNAWISDDRNRIPIRAEAKVLVGSIKMDLTEYAGLIHPLALEEKK
ncbi:MAG: DUF3108 domain-containing protein [Bacteroidetes bacterium]|nr:DUF3108 domain-containing protein [Bacteroidota bacterium]